MRLFARTTRSLRLTAEGEQYLPTAHSVLETLQQGKENLRGENATLRGVLQVTAPSDLGLQHTAAVADAVPPSAS